MCYKPYFAKKGCSSLLEPQKVAPNGKSCSKLAENNRDPPTLIYPF